MCFFTNLSAALLSSHHTFLAKNHCNFVFHLRIFLRTKTFVAHIIMLAARQTSPVKNLSPWYRSFSKQTLRTEAVIVGQNIFYTSECSLEIELTLFEELNCLSKELWQVCFLDMRFKKYPLRLFRRFYFWISLSLMNFL